KCMPWYETFHALERKLPGLEIKFPGLEIYLEEFCETCKTFWNNCLMVSEFLSGCLKNECCENCAL
ncbi:MAG: hypothetical protein U0L77_06930, partial [Prevotellamassilia sp.]|nr:hypothetical protein [Prevotellamassilia sp.]